jgi:hypothetical protein
MSKTYRASKACQHDMRYARTLIEAMLQFSGLRTTNCIRGLHHQWRCLSRTCLSRIAFEVCTTNGDACSIASWWSASQTISDHASPRAASPRGCLHLADMSCLYLLLVCVHESTLPDKCARINFDGYILLVSLARMSTRINFTARLGELGMLLRRVRNAPNYSGELGTLLTLLCLQELGELGMLLTLLCVQESTWWSTDQNISGQTSA